MKKETYITVMHMGMNVTMSLKQFFRLREKYPQYGLEWAM